MKYETDILFLVECNGEVVLSSFSHDYTFTIPSEELQQKRRKRKKIKLSQDGERLTFELANMTGNCRWSLWNKPRRGESFGLDQVGTHEPGWSIRAVKLL